MDIADVNLENEKRSKSFLANNKNNNDNNFRS